MSTAIADATPHLVLGGARSGKSSHAENLVARFAGPYIYVATAQVLDEEMRERVDKHRERRGSGWQTVETPLDLPGTLKELRSTGRPVLVDCLTLWLSNLLLQEDSDRHEERVEALCRRIQEADHPLVLVSNEVGSGIVPENALARRFRDLAGFANQRVAEACRRVTLVVAGLPVKLK